MRRMDLRLFLFKEVPEHESLDVFVVRKGDGMTISQEQTICCHVYFRPFLEEHLVRLLQILYKACDNSSAISVVCALVRG